MCAGGAAFLLSSNASQDRSLTKPRRVVTARAGTASASLLDPFVFPGTARRAESAQTSTVSRQYVAARPFAEVYRYYWRKLAVDPVRHKYPAAEVRRLEEQAAPPPQTHSFARSADSGGKDMTGLLDQRRHVSTAVFVQRLGAGTLSVSLTRAKAEPETSIVLVASLD
jgi:hypothetical protein